MRTRMLIIVAILPLVAIDAGAQARQAPAPPAELKQLEYFVGDWKTDADVKASQYVPAGKFTATDHGEWLNGGFFVVTHSDYTMPTGGGSQLSLLGYDSSSKLYTFESFSSAGIRSSATGTLDGDTWTWTSTQPAGSRTMQIRHTMKILSPSSYSFKFETSMDGNIWASFIEGHVTKLQ